MVWFQTSESPFTKVGGFFSVTPPTLLENTGHLQFPKEKMDDAIVSVLAKPTPSMRKVCDPVIINISPN